jgi:hypothetical protein
VPALPVPVKPKKHVVVQSSESEEVRKGGDEISGVTQRRKEKRLMQ